MSDSHPSNPSAGDDQQPLIGEPETAEAPSEPTPIPERIGKYHLKRVIAAGGMGVVYEAVQSEPRRAVAVKVMRRGLVSRASLRRFQNEAQLLARLRHPNIAQVYDAGVHEDETGRVPYFVMEYIPGAESITAYARRRNLKTRERLELFLTMCDAVHHGHQRGIIHRDLKPSNVLVDSNGQVKIIDFGVARSTDADIAITSQQTDVGQLIGTLQYMSPEQVNADPHDIDVRSDVYTLGVLLFELLCDRPPYRVTGHNVYEATRVIQEEEPTRPSSIDRRLHGDIETIVLKAMRKDRSARYETATQLRADVERYLANQPITARRPTLGYLMMSRWKAFSRRQPRLARGFAVLGVIVAVAFFARAVGDPIVYEWTSAHDYYKQFLSGSSWFWSADDSFEHVAIVRITDGTKQQAAALAERYGLEGVSGEAIRSLRRLHGRAMERLAVAGVRVVTWDFSFGPPSPFDADFRRGVERLRQTGADVVVSVKTWDLADKGRGQVSPGFMDVVEWGGSTATFEADEAWYLHLLIERPGSEAMCSYALRAFAAYRMPGWQVDVRRRQSTLELRYFRYADPADPRARTPSENWDYVEASTVLEYADDPLNGRKPGDSVPILLLDIPADEILSEASVEYEWVLTADEPSLRDRLGGRAVLVGDFSSAARRFPLADGRELPGCVGQAVGIEAMARHANVRIEQPATHLAFIVVATALGALIGVVLPARRLLSIGLLLVLIVVVVLFSRFAYESMRYFVNPVVPLMGLCVGWAITIMANGFRTWEPG